MQSNLITEKKLGITGDYQFRALKAKKYLQANWHQNKLTIIGKLLDLYGTKTLLDLGTGSGNLELTFSSKLNKIVGVDYNDEALKFLKSQLTKRKIKNVKLVQADILNPSKLSKLGKFDMVIMVDVIEHLEAKKGTELIKSFKKLLNKNGKVVIITPNYSSLWPLIESFMDRFTPGIPHLDGVQHVTKFNEENLRKIFKKNGGYKMVKSSTFNSFAYLIPGKKISECLTKLELDLALPFGNL